MDKILEEVIYRMRERSEVGIKKYGTTLDRDDLSHLDWLNHLQEELMDAINYIQKLKHNEITRLSNTNQRPSITNTESL
jgi:uncharacterized membrane protein YukC